MIERRLPGYVLVLVLIVAGLLATIPIFLFRPTFPTGSSILLIVATDIIAATPETQEVPAALGPLCSDFVWDHGRRVLTVESDADMAGVEGLLLLHYGRATSNLLWEGGGGDPVVRPIIRASGAAWRLTSPVDGRALTTFFVAGGTVFVENESYGPGDAWSLHFAYDVTVSGVRVHITEDIAFLNEGVVVPRVIPSQPCARID